MLAAAGVTTEAAALAWEPAAPVAQGGGRVGGAPSAGRDVAGGFGLLDSTVFAGLRRR